MATALSGKGDRAALHFSRPPSRVVSLVPSVTESLFDLGLGDRIVGITDYCVHPVEGVAGLTRVGGTKSPDLDRILSLGPELVIANQEENREADVRDLEAAGVSVWVTFPQSAEAAIDLLRAFVMLFDVPRQALSVKSLEQAFEWSKRAAEAAIPVRVFCPIWRDTRHDPPLWWMTANRHTYLHSVLTACGGQNVFADRERQYPLAAELGISPAEEDESDRDSRYPRVTPEEIRALDPEVILLPSEPYAFGEPDRTVVAAEFSRTSAARGGRVHLVDGSLLTWHGTRLARALDVLPALLSSVE